MKRRTIASVLACGLPIVLLAACSTDTDVGQLADAGDGDVMAGLDGTQEASPTDAAGGDADAGPRACLDEQQQLKPGWCLIDGVCYVGRDRNPRATCEICDPELSTSSWSVPALDDHDRPCVDLPCITNGQGCHAGRCSGPVALTQPSDEACLLPGGECYPAGRKPYPGACEICDPARSKTSLSAAAHDCEIDGACMLDGEKHHGVLFDADGYSCASCDPGNSQSSWTIAPGFCFPDGRCADAGEKNQTGCGVCDPAADPLAWSSKEGGCSIGGLCHEAGALDPTQCRVCDPAKSTSSWSDRDHDCEIDGVCYVAADTDDTGCGSCDPAASTDSWTVASDMCRIQASWGGISCLAAGEQHPSGTCAVCDPATSQTSWTITAADTCLIEDTCRTAGEAYPDGGCATCDPATSQTSWTPDAGKCLIGEPYGGASCHDAGESHPAGDCAVCDPSTSQTGWTVVADKCLVDDFCAAAGEQHWDGCAVCDPATSQTSWTPDTAGKCVIAYGGWNPDETRCYADGESHPNGDCAVCDTATNPYAWTVVKGCLVLDQCHEAGAGSGCGVCDPAQSTSELTPVPGCEIPYYDCFPDGTPSDSAPCAVCDVSQSTTGWSVTGSGCLINYQCYAPGGQLVPGDDCATCDPQYSQTAWKPSPASCVLSKDPFSVKMECYSAGAAHPHGSCAVCAPQKSQTEWTVVSGCLIDGLCINAGDPCGAVALSCPWGCWVCDPSKSQTSWSKGTGCVSPSGRCLADQETVYGDCAVCDASQSPPSLNIVWGCLIDDECVQPDLPSTDGCASCDPSKSQTDWTVVADKCLIGEQCVANNNTDATGCLTCDASATSRLWSAAAGTSVVDHSFDAGTLGGVVVSPLVDGFGWQLSSRRAANGNVALWFGNAATGSSAVDRPHRASVTLPATTLASGGKAALSFMLWAYEENTPGPSNLPTLIVLVDDTVVWFGSAQEDPAERFWRAVTIDLSPYAAKSVVVRFVLDVPRPHHPPLIGMPTLPEGVYLDAIQIVSGCS